MTHWAIPLIGAPWVNGAAGPDAFDCYGLVRYVQAQRAGVVMPVVDAEGLSTLSAARAMRDYGDYGDWAEVSDFRELDVLQLGHARHPHHVGLWVDADGGGVLHCVAGAGVVFQRLPQLAAHGWRVLGHYRRRAA